MSSEDNNEKAPPGREPAGPEDAQALSRWVAFIEGVLAEMEQDDARPAAHWLRERLQAELAQKRKELARLGAPAKARNANGDR